MALVLELLAGRRDVGMPDLRLLAPGELDLALVERRLELQQQERLFDVEDLRHSRVTLAKPVVHATDAVGLIDVDDAWRSAERRPAREAQPALLDDRRRAAHDDSELRIGKVGVLRADAVLDRSLQPADRKQITVGHIDVRRCRRRRAG